MSSGPKFYSILEHAYMMLHCKEERDGKSNTTCIENTSYVEKNIQIVINSTSECEKFLLNLAGLYNVATAASYENNPYI